LLQIGFHQKADNLKGFLYDSRTNKRKNSFSSGITGSPEEKEQIAIADILSDMDAEIVALETKLVKARQIKQGMMQNLLTGKIRLV
jgi:type I restriction enzyme S subunit